MFKYKKLEKIRVGNQEKLQRIEGQVNKIESDYFGSVFSMSYGFKTTTEITLRKLDETVNDLVKRVKELESIVRLSGIVEELDTTDVVKLPKGNITISDVLDGKVNSTSQYVVNKVN